MMNFSLIKMFGSWTQLFKSVGERAEIPQGAWMIMVQYGYLVESLILVRIQEDHYILYSITPN